MIFCIAGTGDGRELARQLAAAGWPVLVSVVSEYGGTLVKEAALPVLQEALDQEGMAALFRRKGVRLVVDASHPYAVNVSRNAMAVCARLGLAYLRYERRGSALPAYGRLQVVAGYEEAAQAAAALGETIFLTTGSRQLEVFRRHPALQGKRLIARVLPDAQVLTSCRELGFLPRDLVAIQGPFSRELNQALFRAFAAEVVVLKNSGSPGGCEEKIAAAAALDLQVVLIDRPRLDYPACFQEAREVLAEVQRLLGPTSGKDLQEPLPAERNNSADNKEVHPMEFMTDPQGIERKSMEIIAPHLTSLSLPPETAKVYARMIHAAGDPQYAEVIEVHPAAVEAGLTAIRAGKTVFCDVEMVRTGINKKRLAQFGGTVECLIADEEVARQAKESGITRSMAAMRAFGARLHGAVVAIGNAPTALFEVLRLMEEEGIRPALIIGVPVGFVGAAESKELLAQTSPVPYITVRGNKGGSPIAASAFNAILYQAAE